MALPFGHARPKLEILGHGLSTGPSKLSSSSNNTPTPRGRRSLVLISLSAVFRFCFFWVGWRGWGGANGLLGTMTGEHYLDARHVKLTFTAHGGFFFLYAMKLM